MRIVFVICFLAISCVSFSGGDLPLYVLKMIGTLNQEEGKSIALSSDGRIYVLSSTNAVQSSNTDILVSCLDQNMNCIWSKTYGGSGVELPNEIVINSSDEVFISGTSLNPSTDGYDVFLLSISLDGDEIFSTTLNLTSWQIAHSMVLMNERPLLMFEDFSSDERYRMFELDEDNVWSELPMPITTQDKEITAFFAKGGDVIMASRMESWEMNTQNPVTITRYSELTNSVTNFGLDFNFGNLLITSLNLSSDGIIHVAGEVTIGEFRNGYYARYDDQGNFIFESVLQGSGNYGFTDLFVTETLIITPGYTYLAGGGGMDGTVMIQTIDGMFLNGPTCGGENTDYLIDAVRRENGEVICVGSSFSYNGNNGETMLLYLSNTSEELYDQEFDLENNCFVVGVDENKISRTIKSTNYYDLMGRRIELENSLNQICIKIVEYDNGEFEVTKELR